MDPTMNPQVLQMLQALTQGQGGPPGAQAPLPGMDAQSQQASLGTDSGIGLQQGIAAQQGQPAGGGLTPDAMKALMAAPQPDAGSAMGGING